MNLYINIPYKTGEHRNETKHNFIHLYIKISISFFSSQSLTRALRGLQGAWERRGASRKVCTSTEITSMQNDKPLQIQRGTVGIQNENSTGKGTEAEKKQKSNESLFNGLYKLASSVFNTYFIFCLFDLILLSLNIQKVHSHTSTKYLKKQFPKWNSWCTHTQHQPPVSRVEGWKSAGPACPGVLCSMWT